jgi:hypothetical protein
MRDSKCGGKSINPEKYINGRRPNWFQVSEEQQTQLTPET